MQRSVSWGWVSFISSVILGSLMSLVSDGVNAQVIPDATLGSENSQVRRATVRGREADLIEGGATRGRNLFHSFREFGVREGDAAYFANPATIENIFSRVTGSNPSNILGVLGVDGAANLFFMNPNGIVFGPNAQLDVGGSFVGTTANAIGFGEAGFFSATNPEVPSQVLTVNPSAFFLNQVNPGRITNSSVAPAGTSPSGIPLFGLRVPNGQSLLLVGGDITMDRGRLTASGGRIELGGLAEPGSIGLETDGPLLSLSFPQDRTLSNFALANDAVVVIPGSGGGAIVVNADTFTATGGGRLVTVAEGPAVGGDIEVNANALNFIGRGARGRSGLIAESFPDATGNAGDITVNAESIVAQNGGVIVSGTFGAGEAGDVRVSADSIELVGRDATRQFGSSISSAANAGSTGRGGDVTVSTRLLQLREGANISVSTAGAGTGGNLQVEVTERAELVGSAINAQGQVVGSGLFAATVGDGAAGSLQFEGGQLLIRDGAVISAATFGAGDAGEVSVTADSIELVGRDATRQFASGIGSEAAVGSTGRGGDVTVSTRLLQLREGANISVSTRGAGQGGNLQVEATERAELVGATVNAQGQVGVSGLFAATVGDGAAGSLQFEGGQLLIRDGAVISAATFGAGEAGDVTVTADSIELVGLDVIGQGASGINSEAAVGSTGRGGDVTVSTRLLQVREGATISVGTRGAGQGGNLQVEATERAELVGSAVTAQGQVSGSGLFAATVGDGAAGSLQFEGGQLLIRDGAVISAATAGAGDAGDVTVTADSIELVGPDATGQFPSSISSEAAVGSTGRGGDVTVSTRLLQLREGAGISVSTRGAGQGGNLQVEATERAELVGTAVTAQGQVGGSGLFAATVGDGAAGSLQFEGGQLLIRDGAVISAATFGAGAAGDVRVSADRIELVGQDATRQFRSGINSEVNAGSTGRGGDVTVSTRQLTIRNGAGVSTSTGGPGDAGNLRITVEQLARLTGTAPVANGQRVSSGVFATTANSGEAGRIEFDAQQLVMRDGAVIATTTGGSGSAGDIVVRVDDAITLTGTSGNENSLLSSRIDSSIQPGATGDAGDIQIQARLLSLNDGAQISAAVSREVVDSQGNLFPGGRGNAGNIRLDISDSITLAGTDASGGFSSGVVTLSERGALGNAGAITIQTGELRITDGAIVTASTFNPGRSGNITLRAENLELLNGGQIVTNTRNQSDAGRIRLDVADNITISGVDPDWQERRNRARAFSETSAGRSLRVNDIIVNQGRQSGIFANTEAVSTGNGGSIRLSTTNLDLSDRARISAQSQGTGAAGGVTIRASEDVTLNNRARISTQSQGENAPAGDIQIEAANTFTATDSDVSTSAANASGGDIRLTTGDVRLFGDSDIRTNSARDGGNITVNADTVVALDDSDVFASAAQGRGGDITLNTPAFFGNNYQPEESENAEVSELDNNNRVDLNATGTVSSGTISTPDTSFIQNSLSDLTENVVDTDSLIANSCIARSETGGTFLITGTGGLPPRPGSASLSTYPTGAVRTEAGEAESSSWKPGDPIVEPQGVYRLPDGRLVMSRDCQ